MQEQEPQPLEQPQIVRKSYWPSGSVPKHKEKLIWIGVCLLMFATIFYSGAGKERPRLEKPLAERPTQASNPKDYEQYLKEQEAKLRLGLKKITAGNTDWDAMNKQAEQGYQIPGQPIVKDGRAYYPVEREQQEPIDPIEQERKKREYQSLFASNVALSYRPKETKAEPTETQRSASGQTLVENHPNPNTQATESKQPSGHKLFEGTLIETVLTNRLEGQFAGPVIVMVTTDVYSHDGQTLLIAKGTKVLGEAKQVAHQDQQRLAVLFHRMIMPDGFSVSLDEVLGLNQEGGSALKDKVNHHYLQTFGTSIAYGLLAGFSMWGSQGVWNGDGTDVYRQGVATQLGRTAQQNMQRSLNRLPDITIQEGHRVKILLNKDLTIPAYKDHQAIEGL